MNVNLSFSNMQNIAIRTKVNIDYQDENIAQGLDGLNTKSPTQKELEYRYLQSGLKQLAKHMLASPIPDLFSRQLESRAHFKKQDALDFGYLNNLSKEFFDNSQEFRLTKTSPSDSYNHSLIEHANIYVLNQGLAKLPGISIEQNLSHDGVFYLGLLNNYHFVDKYSSNLINNFSINSYGKENTINTNFGKAEVFLDLYDDNDKLGIGKLKSNSELFHIDTNRNGKVEAGDKYFDKLKIRAYDKDGNEIIKKLSEVVSHINLRDFIKDNPAPHQEALDVIKDHRIFRANANSYFKPEHRYDKMEKKEIHSMFNNYADKDGWIDLLKSGIFDYNHGYINFAYEKMGFNGEVKLDEFNIIGIEEQGRPQAKNNPNPRIYSKLQQKKINDLYNEYMKEKKIIDIFTKDLRKSLDKYDLQEYSDKFNNYKSDTMLQIERIFEKVTNLDFSIENLNKVKNSFNQNLDKAAASLQDSDAVVAMKLNENGTITLKFNSGREINVKSLYKDSGGLLDGENATLNLKAKTMNEEELNKLDFKVTAIKITNEKTKKDEFVSLKDLGAKIIKKLSNLRFEIITKDNKVYNVGELYMLFKFDEIKPKSEKELFYPKPFDVRV